MTYSDLPVEQIRHNINGLEVTFVDRCLTGLKIEEVVVNELSLRHKNQSIASYFLYLLLASACFYVLYEYQSVALASICLGLAILSCFIYLNFFWIKKETVTVIKSSGVQVTTLYATGRRQTQFIDLNHISDIVINEAISMHRVVYYLAILLKDDPQLKDATSVIPVFLHSMPRLDTLTEVYQSIHSVLWEDEKKEQ